MLWLLFIIVTPTLVNCSPTNEGESPLPDLAIKFLETIQFLTGTKLDYSPKGEVQKQTAILNGTIQALATKVDNIGLALTNLDTKISTKVDNIGLALTNLDTKIATLDSKISTKVDNLDAKITTKLDNLDAKLDVHMQTLNSKLDIVKEQLDNHNENTKTQFATVDIKLHWIMDRLKNKTRAANKTSLVLTPLSTNNLIRRS